MIERFFHAESSTHTYLIVRGNECVIIDPVLGDVDQYSDLIKEQNLKLAYELIRTFMPITLLHLVSSEKGMGVLRLWVSNLKLHVSLSLLTVVML